ncbi:slc38a7, partial [Symbiodinium pilosum]
FNAHTNAVPVAMALDQPRAARIWQVSLLSVLIEFVIYASIATAGYLSFGASTKQDFIRNYPADDGWMLLVRCVYSVPVIFGVPINLSPAAASIQALAGRLFLPSQLLAFADVIGLFGAFFGTATASHFDLNEARFVDVELTLCDKVICLVWPLRIYQRNLGNGSEAAHKMKVLPKVMKTLEM